MANPFLVLAGVAVGVITAGVGILSVPGWIDSANNSAVQSDLAQVALAQEAAATLTGSYVSVGELEDGTTADGADFGVRFQPSQGPETAIVVSATGDAWAAISVSRSGHVFVRTSASTVVYKSDAKASTLDFVGDEDNDAEDLSDLAFTPALPAGITIGGTASAPTIVFTP